MAMIFGGVGCTDPASLLSELAAGGIPTEQWAGKAGTFRTGPGYRPGRGWFLFRKSDLDSLDLAADHALAFSGEDQNHVVTLSPITLLHVKCVTPGSSADPNAVYLCECVDRRHLLGRISLDKAYNLTKSDGSGNFTQTKNSGTNWTWQEVVQDIATTIGMGTLTLPFTPDASPNNLVYWGHPSALECLCDVLTRIGCDLAYDPVADEFSVVRLGVAQDTHLDAVDAASKGRVWDGYSAECVRGWYPKYLNVRFMRRPVDTADGYSPYWFEGVTLDAVAGQEDGTFVQIDDDLPALGASGTPSNSAALATRAAERAADWLRKRLYYDRPVLRAWRDFLPDAAGLGALAVREVIFDDRAQFQTWVNAGPDQTMEEWRPQAGWPVWWPQEAGGGSLTAEEVDGTPSYTGTTTLRFDQADGFVVTNPSAGVARIDLIPATATQAGIVSTTSQTIAGNKVFTAAISCQGFGCGSSGSGSPYTGDTSSNGVQLFQHVTDPGSGDKCGWMLLSDPINKIVYFYVGGDYPSVSAVGVLMLTTIDYLIADRAAYGVRHDFVEYTGYTGTLAPGMSVKGGIIVSAGSGSFLADPGDGLAGGTYP
jgi:hypothetical protein